MKMPLRSALTMSSVSFTLIAILSGSAGAKDRDRTSQESKRVPWTTSKVIGTPDAPQPYVLESAFRHLHFTKPTVITSAPGTDRLFVATREGKVFSLAHNREIRQAELILDIGREIYGLTFHPRFEQNRFLYLFITERTPEPPRTRIARFTAKAAEPFEIDAKSEQIVLEFPSNGHDGGCLKFGPDGYLYIGTGDGGNANDVHNTGQFLGDLLASILRIDVDKVYSAKPYAIPRDNPFLDTKGARAEIWAYGFRQPWKFSFDRLTGDLWVGDVGQQLWEMIYRVERGGNYGWSIMEGPQKFRPNRNRGPSPISAPVYAYRHHEGRSITGGFVYRGSRHKKLLGTYVYADYETGRVWGLRHDGKQVISNDLLAFTNVDIAGFAEDHNGELYMLTYEDGRIYELRPAPPANRPHAFPRLLSETGLFSSVGDHQPAPGVIPYSVNVSLWSDGASKERFLAIPGEGQIEFHRDQRWNFPDRTVFVKTFSLEMERGNPASRRRLETRLLTRQGKLWAGYTYLWNDEQTDAELLGAEPLERTYAIRDEQAAGGVRKQTWYFPSRADCMVCHNGSFTVIGVNTLQMNRMHDNRMHDNRIHDNGAEPQNQLAMLNVIGLLSEPLAEDPSDLPRLTPIDDADASIELRARSYLHANCAYCHRYKGGGNSDFKLLFGLPLAETNTLDVKPLHDVLNVEDARLIAPGDSDRSLVYRRMARTGKGRMPQIATNRIDADAVSLIRQWISELPATAEQVK